jgi:hypothetical protein
MQYPDIDSAYEDMYALAPEQDPCMYENDWLEVDKEDEEDDEPMPPDYDVAVRAVADYLKGAVYGGDLADEA